MAKENNQLFMKNIFLSILIAGISCLVLIFAHPLFGKIVMFIDKVFAYADGYLFSIRVVTFFVLGCLAFLIFNYAKTNKYVYWLLYSLIFSYF